MQLAGERAVAAGIEDERDYRPDWREAPDRPDMPADLPSTESPTVVALMRMTRE